MRVVIVGQGAIGGLLALQCHLNQLPFAVITRNNRCDTLSYPTHDLTITPRSLLLAEIEANDIIIVPTKAYQVISAIEQLAPFLSHQAVVLLHNGMGVIDTIKQQHPKLTVYAATTKYGALKIDHHTVEKTGDGETCIGPIQNTDKARDKRVLSVLSTLLPPCRWQQDIQQLLWHKLAINCVINPLTALHQCRNGALVHIKYQQALTTLCQEITKVMGVSGYSLTAESLQQQCLQVCTNTAHNYSSMNRDVFHQRATEIDHITGYLIKQAKRFDVNVPLNTELLHNIRQLTADKS